MYYSMLEPLVLTNIFALVEIKFDGDTIKDIQFQTYKALQKQCKMEKKVSNRTVSEGFKLSLFRYPEDKFQDKSKEKVEKNQSTKTPNRQRKNH